MSQQQQPTKPEEPAKKQDDSSQKSSETPVTTGQADCITFTDDKGTEHSIYVAPGQYEHACELYMQGDWPALRAFPAWTAEASQAGLGDGEKQKGNE